MCVLLLQAILPQQVRTLAQPLWVCGPPGSETAVAAKRLALRYDRLGFIVQSLLQAACLFLVAGRLAREL
jgi:hypothetical protein